MSENRGDGIRIVGNSSHIKGNRVEANGYDFPPSSDLAGLGINVTDFDFATPPLGVNTARGNDSPYECFPAYLC